MTPEELEELRALVGRLNCTAYDENLAVVLGAALEHIDQQATALDEAEALTKRNAELMNGYLTRIEELETQVDLLQNEVFELRKGKESQKIISELMSQIAALQEIATDQLAESNYNFDYNMDSIGKYFWQRDEKFQKEFFDSARRQLAEEHPEAFR